MTAPAEPRPLHPKLIGGLTGAMSGGTLGTIIYGIMMRFHAFAAADETTRQYVAGLIVVLLAGLGQYVFAYFSAWAPKAERAAVAVVAPVLHDLDPDVSTATVVAKLDAIAVKLDAKAEADAEKLLSHYATTLSAVSSGVMTAPTPKPPAAASEPVQDPPEGPAVPETPAAPVDPVLADDTPPAAETDPVLAD